MEHPIEHNHNCDETIAKVVLSLDGGLSEAEEQEFLKEVNGCLDCLRIYDIEKSFKEFLQIKIASHKVDPAVIKKIKDNIKSKMQES